MSQLHQMKFFSLFLILFSLVSTNLKAQESSFFHQINRSEGNDFCWDVAQDHAGNIYCAGGTQGSINEKNAGGWDAIIIKFSAAGKVLWIKHFGALTKATKSGSNDRDDMFYSIRVDASHLYVAGRTNGNMIETSNNGEWDSTVMKLNLDGKVIWAKQFGMHKGSDQCNSLALDHSSNIFCVGTTSGSFAEVNAGGSDVIAFKLNTDGEMQWSRQLGQLTRATNGSNAGHDYANSAAIDQNGHLVFSGSTTGSLGETNSGKHDAYVGKISAQGQLQWIKQLGASTSIPGGNNQGDDFGYGIAINSRDEILLSGNTFGSMGESNGGRGDIFLSKLDTSGQLVWLTQMGSQTKLSGENIGNEWFGNRMAIDSNDNILLPANTNGSVAEASAGSSDAMVIKLDDNGKLVWITQFGASTKALNGNNAASDACNNIAIGKSNGVYCVGSTSGNQAAINAGAADITIFKLTAEGSFSK